MQTTCTDDEQVKGIPFPKLVDGQPRWEVCRKFMTTLFLTNQGNTDIVFEDETERLNNFSVKLLQAEQKIISLDGESSQTTELGRQKKAGHPTAKRSSSTPAENISK